MNINKVICRLCLCNNSPVLNVHSDILREKEVHYKIIKYLYLDIKKDEEFSKFICADCLEVVENFHVYAEKVYQNQRKLRLLIDPDFLKDVDRACVPFEELTISDDEGDLSQTLPLIDNIIVFNGNEILEHKNEKIQRAEVAEDVDSINGASENEIEDIFYDDNTENEKHFVEVEEEAHNVEIEQENNVETEYIEGSSNLTKTIDLTNDIIKENSTSKKHSYVKKIKRARLKKKKHIRKETYDLEELEPHSEFEGFPKSILRNGIIGVRGDQLKVLLAKFYKFKCELCTGDAADTIYPHTSALFLHYKTVHSTPGYVKCCGTVMYSRRNLAYHLACHLEPEAFQCKECGKFISCPKFLRSHMETHLPEEKRTYKCTECPRRFSYYNSYTTHLISHLPAEEQQSHVCQECGKAFPFSGALRTHINYVHIDRNMICDKCGKHFKTKLTLATHMYSHQEDPAECAICYKRFKHDKGLQVHMQREHERKEKRYHCTKCPYSVNTEKYLNEHMKKHEHYGSKNEGSLNSNTLFSCDKCDYTTKKLPYLKNHMKARHSGNKIKPFECNFCGRAFSYKINLTQHIDAIHTGVRKYSCEFCDRKFAAAANFYTHRKKAHPEEFSKIKREKDLSYKSQVQNAESMVVIDGMMETEEIEETDIDQQTEKIEMEDIDAVQQSFVILESLCV